MVKRVSVVFEGRLRKKLEENIELKNSLGMQSAWKFVSDVMMCNFTRDLDRGFVTSENYELFTSCHGEWNYLEAALSKSARISVNISDNIHESVRLSVSFFTAKGEELLEIMVGFRLKDGKSVLGMTLKVASSTMI